LAAAEKLLKFDIRYPEAGDELLAYLKRQGYLLSSSLLRWYFRSVWGMTIGEGVRISRSAKLDKTNPKGVYIGDYTAVAFGSAILTHDFINGAHKPVRIGKNCLIGAHSVVLPGVTIGDSCIVGVGSIVVSDVPSNTVVFGNPARVVERGVVAGRWGIRDPRFLALEGVAGRVEAVQARAAREVKNEGDRLNAIQTYIPGYKSPKDTFEQLGIDSFGLVTLRAAIEEGERITIGDDDWAETLMPVDLGRFLKGDAYRSGAEGGADPKNARAADNTFERTSRVNMPQMSMGGLSENWLFKEMGDLHWEALTTALGVKSSEITDQNGNRLYATFTRIRLQSDVPLVEIRENDELHFQCTTTRYGAGMFFSHVVGSSSSGSFRLDVMSNFSKFGVPGDARSMTKGQPVVPESFIIPSESALPAFASEYMERRTEELSPALISGEYEIQPTYDVNGVGLLYFAAYVAIDHTCLHRYFGNMTDWSVVERDICYFANCRADDKIVFRIHEADNSGDFLRLSTSLSRESDGKLMAVVRSRFVAFDKVKLAVAA
jgi:probable biosynthetic protein (TIGR04098 family)